MQQHSKLMGSCVAASDICICTAMCRSGVGSSFHSLPTLRAPRGLSVVNSAPLLVSYLTTIFSHSLKMNCGNFSSGEEVLIEVHPLGFPSPSSFVFVHVGLRLFGGGTMRNASFGVSGPRQYPAASATSLSNFFNHNRSATGPRYYV